MAVCDAWPITSQPAIRKRRCRSRETHPGQVSAAESVRNDGGGSCERRDALEGANRGAMWQFSNCRVHVSHRWMTPNTCDAEGSCLGMKHAMYQLSARRFWRLPCLS